MPPLEADVLLLEPVPSYPLVATGVVGSLEWATGVELGGGAEALGVVCALVARCSGALLAADATLEWWVAVAACCKCRRIGTCLT